jgi:hypothetical protein
MVCSANPFLLYANSLPTALSFHSKKTGLQEEKAGSFCHYVSVDGDDLTKIGLT